MDENSGLHQQIKDLKASVASLQNSADRWREKYTTYCHEYHSAAKERDEALAKIKTLTAELKLLKEGLEWCDTPDCHSHYKMDHDENGCCTVTLEGELGYLTCPCRGFKHA